MDTYVEESEDVAQIFSDWKSHFMSTMKGMKNDFIEHQETNKPKGLRLLSLFQKLAKIPSSTTPLHSKRSKSASLNVNAKDHIAATSSCWTCISSLFRFKPKSGDNKQSFQEATKPVKSILLGHSADVVVGVEIFEVKEGKMPPFDIKISPVSEAKYGGRYRGLYSWPRNGENSPDHFYGEFSDGD